ncbi:hypothetical protein V1504DRAFT_442202 [Lipomyces starkeyi]
MSLIDSEPDRRSHASPRDAAWRIDSVHEVIAKEDPMESEISEVLEILRGPLPSDSVLEFIVSEDGYKKIIEEREKSNRKYRVWYDGESHKVTINCCPSHLHEHTSQTVIDSMVDEAVRVMRNAGVSDYVISKVKKSGHLTSLTRSRKKSYKEPDGLKNLTTSNQKKATIAVLLCLTEVDKSSGAHRTTERGASPRGPLEYNGYKWFGTLRDAFFETYRDTDAGIVKSEPVYLVKDGVDLTNAIPRDLTVKVGDFVPRNWESDDVVRRLAVNFLRPQTFMEGLSDAIVRTALYRVEDTFEVEDGVVVANHCC